MKQITFTLEQQEVELLLKSLSKLPLEESFTLFVKLKNTAFDQLNPKPEVQESNN